MSPAADGIGFASAIVPAAGAGRRLGAARPKALLELDGVPLFLHATRALLAAPEVAEVVVAAPVDEVAAVAAVLPPRARAVPGGDTRQRSVAAALAALSPGTTVVLVHDAARPLTPTALVSAVALAVRAGRDAVVPGLPVTDTIKQVDSSARVVSTLRRGDLRAVQTPQGFRRDLLEAAHAGCDTADQVIDEVTDDAGLVERAGAVVTVVPGSEEAFKVTRPLDLALAAAVLAARTPQWPA